MADSAELLPGTLDLLILKSVSLRRLHDYVVQPAHRADHGRGAADPAGALYPALSRLEHRELIESEWGTSENNRRAKYYRLTAAGRQRLGEEVASWQRLADAMAMALRTTPREV